MRLVTIPVHIRADIVDVDIYIGHISTNTILTNGLLGFIFCSLYIVIHINSIHWYEFGIFSKAEKAEFKSFFPNVYTSNYLVP